jgi:hypothetical protein
MYPFQPSLKRSDIWQNVVSVTHPTDMKASISSALPRVE